MKISEYHVWQVNIIISGMNRLIFNEKKKCHANTGDKCDLSILIKIYAITESKHGKAMVNGNRLSIYRLKHILSYQR